jgi:hypothetical protein
MRALQLSTNCHYLPGAESKDGQRGTSLSRAAAAISTIGSAVTTQLRLNIPTNGIIDDRRKLHPRRLRRLSCVDDFFEVTHLLGVFVTVPNAHVNHGGKWGCIPRLHYSVVFFGKRIGNHALP